MGYTATADPLPEWLVPPHVQEWAQTVSLFDVLVWSAGALGLVLAIRWAVQKGWPAVKRFAAALSRFVHVVESVNDLPQFMVDTTSKIDEIHHEVHFNNGSSVKDAVTRVEGDVVKVKAALGISDDGDEDRPTPHP